MNYFLIILIGIFGGIISGLFGVGGGLIFVPLMTLLMKLDLHMAIGTSLAIVIPTATVGVIRNAHAHLIDWKVALMLSIFAIIGAWFGAGLSIKLDLLLLRRLFAGFLVFLAAKMFFQN